MKNSALFTSIRPDWRTGMAIQRQLEHEFQFTLDPCPPNPEADGLVISWEGHRVYCNPPYGRYVLDWIHKHKEAELAVYLLPARTDTEWFHYCVKEADEIRFIRGRLRFDGATENAPFPSVLIIFRKEL